MASSPIQESYVRTRTECLPSPESNHFNGFSCFQDFNETFYDSIMYMFYALFGCSCFYIFLSYVAFVGEHRKNGKSSGAVKILVYHLCLISAGSNFVWFIALWNGIDATQNFLNLDVIAALLMDRSSQLAIIFSFLFVVTEWKTFLNHQEKTTTTHMKYAPVYIALTLLMAILVPVWVMIGLGVHQEIMFEITNIVVALYVLTLAIGGTMYVTRLRNIISEASSNIGNQAFNKTKELYYICNGLKCWTPAWEMCYLIIDNLTEMICVVLVSYSIYDMKNLYLTRLITQNWSGKDLLPPPSAHHHSRAGDKVSRISHLVRVSGKSIRPPAEFSVNVPLSSIRAHSSLSLHTQQK